jgi:diadenosine tetraphosphate (Ap4A) HIT family hydrolase
MPQSPDELYASVTAAADRDGRLPLSRMTGWEIFPFEPDGLRVVALRPPVLPEPPRNGEAGQSCRACTSSEHVWEDEHWRLSVIPEPSGAPLVLVLRTKAHVDLPTLPDDRAGELGRLVVHIARAIESLPHVARAHVSRWGDGGAHVHLFFYARPAGFSQLRGTCLAIWDDLLPPTPRDRRDDDATTVAESLISTYGGTR